MSIKSESILAVNSEFLTKVLEMKQGMNLIPFEEFVVAAAPNLIIGMRSPLETDPRFRQVLPYVVLTQLGHDGETRFIVYQRGKGVGESRLAGQVSVGFGGHIDLVDVKCLKDSPSVIDLPATIGEAVIRELSEELVLNGAGAEMPLFSIGFLTDNTNDVGLVHLGVIMNAQLPPDATAECAEEQMVMLAPMTAQELLTSGLDLENWTRIVLEHYMDLVSE